MAPMASPGRSQAFAGASVPANYERFLAPVIFEPWAEILVERIGVQPGDRVLDVASGTGVAARQAAQRAGPSGRVVATDASEAMLAHAATTSAAPTASPIEYVPAPATELPFRDDAFDALLCQQGLQFFADRPAAVAEFHRVLQPGGVAGIAVWAAGHGLEPFEDYSEVMLAAEVEPPYPRAYEASSYCMAGEEINALLTGAGFTSVDTSIVELTIAWPDAATRVAGISGTPFGPLVAALSPERRAALESELAGRGSTPDGEPLRRASVAVLAVARA